MDLMGPMAVESNRGKKYVLFCIDDYSRFTWVDFLRDKNEAFTTFKRLTCKITVEKDEHIINIRSDHDKEFENQYFDNFCSENGISHEYSAPKTPQ